MRRVIDHDRALERLSEVLRAASHQLVSLKNGYSTPQAVNMLLTILVKFVVIVPPEKEPFEGTIQYITLDSLNRGGRSYKPGNILINIRSCMAGIVGASPTIKDSLLKQFDPFDLIFGLVALAVALNEAARIDISEDDASVLWTMWINRDDRNCLEAQSLLKMVNLEMKNAKRNKMSKRALDSSLTRLTRIGCIKKLNSEWRVVERITNSFY